MLFGLFSIITQKIGVSLLNYEMFLFYIWFAGSGVSAYIFTRVLNFGMVARISSSLIYMINPFALVLIWSISQGQVQIEYALLPAIIGLFIYGITNKKSFRYIACLQLLWFSLGLFGTQANVQLTLVYWIIIFIIFIFYSLHKISKHDLSSFFHGTKFLAFSIIIFGMLNFYWLIPTILHLPQYFQHYTGMAETAFIPNIDVYRQNSVFISGAIRLMGYWAFDGAWEGGEYYSFASIYASNIMIMISFIIPTIVIFGIRKLKSVSLLLIPLYISGLFLIKGVNPPFGWINEYVFINFPLVQTSRNAILTWGLLTTLCTSLLFGLGVGSINQWLSKHSKTIKLPHANIFGVSLILFLVIGVLGFPFFTGDVIHSPTNDITSTDVRIDVPEYYDDFKNFIDSEQGDFRILALPLHKAGNVFLNWTHGYIGPDPIFWFSDKPIVYWNNLSPMFKLLGESFGDKPINKQNVADILSMLNIKYIVVHEDTEWRLVDAYKSQFYFSNLEIINDVLDAPNIEFHHRIGKLAIYENTKNTSKIFAANSLVSLESEFDSVKDILQLNILKPNSIIFSENQEINELMIQNNSLFQVKELSINGTFFFTPNEAINDIHYSLPDVNTIIIDGNLVKLSEQGDNLLQSSNVFIWSSNNTSKDSLTRAGTFYNWTIDLSSVGGRNINFELESQNVSPRIIDIMIDGDDSKSPITFLLYDSFGQYIAWNRIMDWNGTEKISLSLLSYDYSSNIPSTFQNKSVDLLSMYYYPKNIIGNITNIINPSILINISSSNSWPVVKNVSLDGGRHFIQFPEHQSGFGEILIASTKEPIVPYINYSKLSPNEYHITVNNASSPFYLYFSETFDQDWKVYDETLPFLRIFSKSIVSDENHFLVNGFANAWFINETGTFSFTLYHFPQAIYEVSLTLTIITVLLMGIIVFITLKKYFQTLLIFKK
ncbi:MAG: hypothetical protein CMN79_04265 [Spirochaetales bacterium]|nr:hypothetical protein [Spirochaetales bacterium]